MQTHVPLAVVLGVVAIAIPLVLWATLRGRGRRSADPTFGGLGGAVALVLEGSLDAAAELVEHEVRQHGASPEHVLAWVALLRARDQGAEAARLVERLSRRVHAPWLSAMRVRLALDAGHIDAALAHVLAGDAPTDLSLSTLMRAGRWAEAHTLYEGQVSKRDRQPRVLAVLHTGRAVIAAQRGQSKAARKAIKRALGFDEHAVIVQTVAARLLADRPRPKTEQPMGASPEPGLGTLQAAREEYERGSHQHALGLLRDHLDAVPQDQRVRRQYGAWLLEHGGPADWRAELADILSTLTGAEVALGWKCTGCSVVVHEAVFVCPRCDGMGPFDPVDARADLTPFGGSLRGARVQELIACLPASLDEEASVASSGG